MPYAELLPSGRYRAVYRLRDGTKRSIPGTYPHKRKAEIAAAAKESEVRALGWRDPESAGRPWGQWCDDWWSKRDVEPGVLKRDEFSRDRYLLPKWADTPLIDITKGAVRAWAKELKDQGLAPATVQKRIYLLSASLTAAVEHEILEFNPAARVKVAQPQIDKRRYLTDDETGSLLAQFGPPVENPLDEAIVCFLLGAGARWGEMAGLQIPRVDFKRGRVYIVEAWDNETKTLVGYPKGKRQRWIPLEPWLAELLEWAIGDRTTGHVFLHRGRFVLEYHNWRRESWLPAVERSGVGEVKIHDLRHTFASHALQNGATLEEVGRMLGHKSAQTTQIYAKLAEEFRPEVRAALPNPRRGANVGQGDAA